MHLACPTPVIMPGRYDIPLQPRPAGRPHKNTSQVGENGALRDRFEAVSLAISHYHSNSSYPGRGRIYQRWCVAYDEFWMVSVFSGRSYTDWTATRPGPVSRTQMFR